MKRILTGDKTDLIRLRISPQDKERILKRAKTRGVSLSDIMRHALELVEKEAAAAGSSV